MMTEIITEESIGKYIKILKNEEIFGILDGRITGLGACDDESGQPEGVLVAEIHMEYILLRRIYVLPDCQDEDLISRLMDIVTDLPEDLKAPIYYYGTDEETDATVLAQYGFKEIPNGYSCIEGFLEDYKEIKAPPKLFEVGTLDQVPKDSVQNFVLSSTHDRFMQIPDGYLDISRFSDASLVCYKRNIVVGVILMEETDDMIRIPYMYTKDNMALLYSLYVLRKVLFADYAPKAKLCFVMRDGIGREAIHALIRPSEEKKIRVFRHE